MKAPLLLALLALLLAVTQASEPFRFEKVSSRIQLGSGIKDAARVKAYSLETTVKHNGASWIRLLFRNPSSSSSSSSLPPLIKITSLLDGHVQHLTPETLAQWQFSSAYFNGDSVLVEIFDQSGHVDEHSLEITELMVGPSASSPQQPERNQEKSLCGPDSRELSSYKQSGRYLGSGGCTGWLINDRNGCFLTAHHCGTDSTGAGVMEFEVPLSTATPIGHQIVHPPPEHQYAMDPDSLVRATSPVGVGNDWQYFGCFPNTETGLTPAERQGKTYILSTNLTAPDAGVTTTIIGYGVVEFDKPEEWNQAQKVSHGPHSHDNESNSIWSIHYTVDTTGGDSGSAVEQNGYAVGIHTHGGCSRIFGGVNSGTFIGHPPLQRALANPQGICA